jgi:hypothetical protein
MFIIRRARATKVWMKKKNSNPPPRTAASDADGKAKKKNILW